MQFSFDVRFLLIVCRLELAELNNEMFLHLNLLLHLQLVGFKRMSEVNNSLWLCQIKSRNDRCYLTAVITKLLELRMESYPGFRFGEHFIENIRQVRVQ